MSGRRRIFLFFGLGLTAAVPWLAGARPARAIDVCGNGICAIHAVPPESCSTCPQDCGSCCGNGICAAPENCATCGTDCGTCPAVLVINMMPLAQSAEAIQDSEPNLAVNPSNPLQIAGTAFTDNPTGGSAAPIYVSTNGGFTWTLNNIVPSGAGGTADITLRFGTTTNTLYAGALRDDNLQFNIFRTTNFTSGTAMTSLRNRFDVDQPFVEARTFSGADRVYVGLNDFAGANGRTATIDRTLSGTVASPAFTTIRLETRNTCGQDGPQIRPAIHSDNTVYGVFYRWRAPTCVSPRTADIVVVRDDNG
ncbi:MAG TPA: hypothetical protein VN851_12075 [Thermoanaerobaculia bacterium]|nr:hypothetical protein [Thermoanaerobaculia bacterium]